jgi:hypothetical protein
MPHNVSSGNIGAPKEQFLDDISPNALTPQNFV